MITASQDFDLGKDTTRIKNKSDAERQRRTVEEILSRFYDDDLDRRAAVQLVADEVGMGKTFVALGVAYSILQAMRERHEDPDLKRCRPRILVIAPQNAALTQKWTREVREFVRRCAHDSCRADADDLFKVQKVERLDELAGLLRTDGSGVVVTQMGIFAGGKQFTHLDLKRRYLLGVLFRFWGNRLQHDARERLLRGAPESWPRSPDELTSLTEEQQGLLPFEDEGVVRAALEHAVHQPEAAARIDALLASCRDISTPHTRGRDERFKSEIEYPLGKIYRDVCFAGVSSAIPLVIVDEAHNWKNGPRQGTNGYRDFERFVAPLTRRVLLLTATPFQLRPEEMLELLRIGSVITPSADAARTESQRRKADAHRVDVLKPVLETAAQQSRRFAASWARLAPKSVPLLRDAWQSDELVRTREELRRFAHLEGRVETRIVERLVEGAAVGQAIEIRDLLREGLRLYAYNEDLSQELGAFVIRHRRRTDHRVFHVGSEFTDTDKVAARRADRSVLHAANGIDVRGDAELPHYLLMRCVSEMKRGKGRSALGTALTGCYSTLLVSAEGKALTKKLGEGVGKTYLDLLLGMVGRDKDPGHPKVEAVVEATLRNWFAGEKTLLFCFRNNTARRLQEILNERIERELHARRDAVMGGAESLRSLRSRFTRREGDLVGLGLDRVLWSLRWAAWSHDVALPDIPTDALRLPDEALDDLARLALRYGVDLTGEQVDRVFVHRAVEHLLAHRLREKRGGPRFAAILRHVADESWVRSAYGIERPAEGDTSEGDHTGALAEAAGLDERGVHHTYEAGAEPSSAQVRELGNDLRERRVRARRQGSLSIFDAYADAPSFWLGPDPEVIAREDAGGASARTLAAMHQHLLSLTLKDSNVDWLQRRMVMQSLRRGLMRESVLLRILPERSELEAGRWGELLVDRLFAPLPGQRETMAARFAVFVEDLQAASGAVNEVGSARHAMYEATRMRDTSFVVLVDGSVTAERRERVFAGFNSPLLPEVLVCTSVGQEGIDLHRHCRNVIHYDLAWNPAVLEQRTGRVDRIGSKTFRERAAAEDPEAAKAYLDVGVPFLAGTYDERMYEEIRIRAQTFEVLTGGDVTTDNLEGQDDGEEAEGTEEEMAFPVLPPEMIADLRVRLHVWDALTTS